MAFLSENNKKRAAFIKDKETYMDGKTCDLHTDELCGLTQSLTCAKSFIQLLTANVLIILHE